MALACQEPRDTKPSSWSSGGLDWSDPDPMDCRYWGYLAIAVDERYRMVGECTPPQVQSLTYLAWSQSFGGKHPINIAHGSTGAAAVIRSAIAGVCQCYVMNEKLKESLAPLREKVDEEGSSEEGSSEEGSSEEGSAKVQYLLGVVRNWHFSDLEYEYPDITAHPFVSFAYPGDGPESKEFIKSAKRFMIAAKHCLDELHVLLGALRGYTGGRKDVDHGLVYPEHPPVFCPRAYVYTHVTTGGNSLGSARRVNSGGSLALIRQVEFRSVTSEYATIDSSYVRYAVGVGTDYNEHSPFDHGYLGLVDNWSMVKAAIAAMYPSSVSGALDKLSPFLVDLEDAQKVYAVGDDRAENSGETYRVGFASDLQGYPYFRDYYWQSYEARKDEKGRIQWEKGSDSKYLLAATYMQKRLANPPARHSYDGKVSDGYYWGPHVTGFGVVGQDLVATKYVTTFTRAESSDSSEEAGSNSAEEGQQTSEELVSYRVSGTINVAHFDFLIATEASGATCLVYQVPLPPGFASYNIVSYDNTYVTTLSDDEFRKIAIPKGVKGLATEFGQVADPLEISPVTGRVTFSLGTTKTVDKVSDDPDLGFVGAGETQKRMGFDLSYFIFWDVGGCFSMFDKPREES